MSQLQLLKMHMEEMAPSILGHRYQMDGDRDNVFTMENFLNDNMVLKGDDPEPDIEEVEGMVVLQAGGVTYLAGGCGWNKIERVS